ncbi:CcmD family protein [Mucilaginibacter arboris]|uniref:CcmD family protein n=1 Tax=Mucilaginibacter arboris TaxID=2682090 RepID=A0A7K1STB0_9SPHI|nr:CcmD family protein [Mucilaginibacter arboris]MVN20340.1 CcmD family protein [Mucilaginibacter arboris]
MKKILLSLLLLFSATLLYAQNNDVEMADQMRSSGKIYVVIATIVIIFIGLAIYLFTIDKRLKKIEREN